MVDYDACIFLTESINHVERMSFDCPAETMTRIEETEVDNYWCKTCEDGPNPNPKYPRLSKL